MTDKPRVFVTRVIPEIGLALIRQHCQADIWPDELPPSYDAMLERVRGVEGILSLLTDRIDARLLDAAGPQLKVISQYAVGYDNIDVQEAARRGIQVGNTPGVLTETTADLAFALLMAAARRLMEGVDFVRAGRWKAWGPTLLLGCDIHGATLGIVGLGRIGQAVARRAAGFDMRVLACDPHCLPETAARVNARLVSLDELLRQADFVTLHTLLTAETRGMIDARALRLMKPTAVLINTSRGAVVDQKALADALRSGEVAYAALDVTDPEPPAPDDPLLALPNVIVVPHLGSASVATRSKMAEMAAENLLAGLRGEGLPNAVEAG
jgi:glyoxylate reductase